MISKMSIFSLSSGLLFSALMSASGELFAQENSVSLPSENNNSVTVESAAEDADATQKYKKILVTGQDEGTISQTTAPQRLSKDKIDLYKFTDVNRALKQTTGVYVREEDGQGLRPNIGLRGTNPDRSKKITFLEDGVLIGPAPYAAPAAYYTPSMNHTETLDVYKGFAAVPYGPNSIGGAIDYLTTSVPGTTLRKVEASTGAFNTQNIRFTAGDSYSNGLGYVVNASHFRSDGFKQLDGGGNTGFLKNDVLAKFKVNLPKGSSVENSIEAKLSYADEDSDETYMGLSSGDLRDRPYRRYASTALDNMAWIHTTAQISHSWVASESVSLKTQVYRHDFDRTWKRMDRFAGAQAPSLYDVLTQPSANAAYFDILSGSEDSSSAVNGAGDLIQAHNHRTFYNQGVQTRLNLNYEALGLKQDTEVGLRFHTDQIRRNHTNERYAMTGGKLQLASPVVGQDAVNTNHAEAVTANFIHNVAIGDFVVSGLMRAESVKYNFNNSLANASIRRSDDVFAPGVSVLKNFGERTSLKASVNRGVSVAGLQDNGGEAQERSVSYEVGFKHASSSGASVIEVVAFYNDYSNITGTCTASTGCTNTAIDYQFNGGRAAIRGVEGRVAHSFYTGAMEFPVQLNATLLNAEFRNDFSSGSAEWGVGQVRSGDPLPYVPQVQYTLTAGTKYRRFLQEFAFIYQGESLDQSVREQRQSISGYGIVDWTGRYALNRETQVFARIDNLLAKDYVVSLRPFGARPGKPQSFMVGLSYQF